MTIHQAILHGEQILAAAGIVDPRWNAERLLMLALDRCRAHIYAELQKELAPGEQEAYEGLLERRSQHCPLAYLEGTQEFYGRAFHVDENVLIPRPETEGIIRQVLALALPDTPRIVDLGSGSGNIPVTLAIELPGALVVAVELSRTALPILKTNSSGRAAIVCSDLYRPPFVAGCFDVVTCNPPYVEDTDFDQLPAETRREPRIALTTSRSLEGVYGGVLAAAAHLLRSSGHLVIEIGFDQLERVLRVCSTDGRFQVRSVWKDHQSIPRTLTLRRSA